MLAKQKSTRELFALKVLKKEVIVAKVCVLSLNFSGLHTVALAVTREYHITLSNRAIPFTTNQAHDSGPDRSSNTD